VERDSVPFWDIWNCVRALVYAWFIPMFIFYSAGASPNFVTLCGECELNSVCSISNHCRYLKLCSHASVCSISLSRAFLTSVKYEGFGVGGNLPVDGALFLEFLPGKDQYLLTLLSLWWAVGQVVGSLISWVFLAKSVGLISARKHN
jgi:MFS family permease